MPDTTNNPNRKSWLDVHASSDFPIQNIPFGVFLTPDDVITIGTRIGNHAIDLGALHQLGYFDEKEIFLILITRTFATIRYIKILSSLEWMK